MLHSAMTKRFGIFAQRAALLDVDVNTVFAPFVGDLESERIDAAAAGKGPSGANFEGTVNAAN